MENSVKNTQWPAENARWPRRLAAFCLALLLISCIGASLLQTAGGRVAVSTIRVPVGDGEWISAQLYKPVSASAQAAVPLVITAHGYLNNSEMQDSTAIELSRRGIAVIAMDLLYHGSSSSGRLGVMGDLSADAMGMIPMVEYASTSLPFVDKSRIGVMGHSAGGACAQVTLMYYGAQYLAALQSAADPASAGGKTVTADELAAAKALNKVSAGFITSFASMTNDQTMAAIQASLGLNYARYDEGGYSTARGNADLSGACDISLALVNSGLSESDKVTSVEIGKYYGSAADGTLRVVYNPAEVHIWMPFSHTSTGYAVDFFTAAFGMENPIPSSHQIWKWKEGCNALGLIACFALLVPAALWLLRRPAFAALRGAEPAPLPAIGTDRKAAAFFWGSWFLSWILSAVSFLPVTNWDAVLAPAGAAMQITGRVFSQPASNFLMYWAVFNGIVGLALYALSRRFMQKRYGCTAAAFGVRIGGRALVRTLALAVCLLGLFYLPLVLAQYFFQVDFRWWLVAITPFSAAKLAAALPYLPFFFVYYLANSLTVNGSLRVSARREWLNLLVAVLGSVLGLAVLILLQYGTDFATGVILFRALPTDWLHIVAAIPLVALIAAATCLNRAFYRMTGKVWLGAFASTLVMVMVCAANTATLSPL